MIGLSEWLLAATSLTDRSVRRNSTISSANAVATSTPLHDGDRADGAQEFGAARGQRIAAQPKLQNRQRRGEPQHRQRDFSDHGCCTVPATSLTSALVMSRISRGT